MATKKKVTNKKRQKRRRFGIGIYCREAHLGWIGAENEEECDTVVAKAKKNALVDRIEVVDRKQGYRDGAYTTHLKVNKRWRTVRSADFLP